MIVCGSALSHGMDYSRWPMRDIEKRIAEIHETAQEGFIEPELLKELQQLNHEKKHRRRLQTASKFPEEFAKRWETKKPESKIEKMEMLAPSKSKPAILKIDQELEDWSPTGIRRRLIPLLKKYNGLRNEQEEKYYSQKEFDRIEEEKKDLYEQITIILDDKRAPLEFYDSAMSILHPKEIAMHERPFKEEVLVLTPAEKTEQPLKPILRQPKPKPIKMQPSLKSPEDIRKELVIQREKEKQLKKSLKHLYENLIHVTNALQ